MTEEDKRPPSRIARETAAGNLTVINNPVFLLRRIIGARRNVRQAMPASVPDILCGCGNLAQNARCASSGEQLHRARTNPHERIRTDTDYARGSRETRRRDQAVG